MQEIHRETRRFNPLKLPKSLIKDLPFKSQPHQPKPQSKPTYMSSRAVVLSKEEKRARDLMQTLSVLKREKDSKRKAKMAEKRKEYERKVAVNQELREQREKRERDEYWRVEGRKRKNADGEEGGGKRRR